MTTDTKKADIYEKITNTIIAAIESGSDDYQLPWQRSGFDVCAPINVGSKKGYRGINQVVLWVIADEKNYSHGLWGTYKQWKELGATVKKGEKAAPVVFWKVVEKDEPEEASEKGQQMFARGYSVFNVSQVENYQIEEGERLSESEKCDRAEQSFGSTGAEIRHGGESAYFSRKEDYIQMPDFSRFHNSEGYYAVLSHETIHWTGAEKRLNRDLSNRFGSQAYAMEELVAELGAAFLCAALEISQSPRPGHVSYIKNWLEVFKKDKRAVFTAASKAQQAVDYLAQLANQLQQAA